MPIGRWDESSAGQKGPILLPIVVQLGLLAAALADIYWRPAGEVRGSKRLWTAAAFVHYVGPISYFLSGRRR